MIQPHLFPQRYAHCISGIVVLKTGQGWRHERPLYLETHHLLKDGLNLNFHVTWGGQSLNIFFFSEMCSNWGIFTGKTVYPPSLCIWPLEQMLCSLGPSDLDFFVHIFLSEIIFFSKNEFKKKKASYLSTAIQAVQNMN